MDCTDSVKFLAYVAAFNVFLSGVHWCLWHIKDKTESKWDDRALEIVDWLLTMTNWVMANRRNPITRVEVKEAVEKGRADSHDP